jgi:glycosyltransferase involved in cell wall biosynthesis
VSSRANGRDVEVLPLGPTDGDAAPAGPRSEAAGFTVLALARFVPVKGMDVLIEAFASAFRDEPAARLVLAGDGPESDALETAAVDAGISSRTTFPGYLDGEARRAAFAAAHVVAVPTRGDYETFGLSALDASAAGVAIVVSDGGALPERVAGGEGIAVPAGDAAALATALTSLRDDADRRRTMGERGRERARSTWSWEQAANAHRTWYAGLERAAGAAKRGPPPGGGPRSG